ncbi:hypothetical protein [Aeromicrobium sp.]|nr:hypothetical protein [Aeromicrobium sp.]
MRPTVPSPLSCDEGLQQRIADEEPGVRLSPEHVLDLRDDVEQSTLASR